MIRVEIDIVDLSHCHNDMEANLVVCAKLKEAGVPIIGGPILPKADFSQGSLQTYEDHCRDCRVYIWKPK